MDMQTLTDMWAIAVAKTGATGAALVVTFVALVVLVIGDLLRDAVNGIRRWFRVRAIRRRLNQINSEAYVSYRSSRQ